MSKTLPLAGMMIAGLVAVLFVADLAAGFPFRRVSIAGDIGFLLSSLIIAYMSWSLLEKPRRT